MKYVRVLEDSLWGFTNESMILSGEISLREQANEGPHQTPEITQHKPLKKKIKKSVISKKCFKISFNTINSRDRFQHTISLIAGEIT